jgi:hypothetical protein
MKIESSLLYYVYLSMVYTVPAAIAVMTINAELLLVPKQEQTKKIYFLYATVVPRECIASEIVYRYYLTLEGRVAEMGCGRDVGDGIECSRAGKTRC